MTTNLEENCHDYYHKQFRPTSSPEGTPGNRISLLLIRDDNRVHLLVDVSK